MQKLVCSTTGTEAQWNNYRVLPPDSTGEIRRFKESSGKGIMIIGSASVVQQLAKQRLIDEFRFFLFPAVLRAGKPLFVPQGEAIQLKMLNTKHFDTGVVRVDYTRA